MPSNPVFRNQSSATKRTSTVATRKVPRVPFEQAQVVFENPSHCDANTKPSGARSGSGSWNLVYLCFGRGSKKWLAVHSLSRIHVRVPGACTGDTGPSAASTDDCG